jgi:hypothetical protein
MSNFIYTTFSLHLLPLSPLNDGTTQLCISLGQIEEDSDMKDLFVFLQWKDFLCKGS